MAATKRTRWECPTGSHPGKLGPSKPRRDDIVRYCLPCSEATGRLVERIAPALERKRQAVKDRAVARRRAEHERAAVERQRRAEAEAARYTFAGVDLRDEVARLRRLRAFGGAGGRLARRPPTFHVRHAKTEPRSTLAGAWPSTWRFQVTIYPGVDLADLRESLVHELAHLYVGGDRSDRNRWHGDRWRRTMRAAFREAYGPDVVVVTNRYHGRYAAALRGRQAETQEATAS